MSQSPHPKKRRQANKPEHPSAASPYTTTLKAFGIALRQIRLAQGMTQTELAHRVGLDRSYIGRLERGQQNPPLLTLYHLAEALHCAITDLMAQADL